jgi:hypothetical protein
MSKISNFFTNRVINQFLGDKENEKRLLNQPAFFH